MSFDDAARQAAEALGTNVGRVVQERLQEFVSQLTDAAAKDRAEVADQAKQALAAAEQTLQDAVAKAREEAIHETSSRFEATLTERDNAFEAALAERTGRIESAWAERKADLEARATRLEEELASLKSGRDTEIADRTSRLEEQLASLKSSHESEIAERTSRLEAEHRERTQHLEAQIAESAIRLESEIAARTAQFESALAERHANDGDAVERLRTERAASYAQMERLVNAFRRLDEGQSLSHLLDVLAVQVAHQVSRSAIFVVRGQSLQGWAFSGFNGAPLDARSLSVPLDKLPALADVVRQGGRSDVHTAGFAAADVNPLAFVSLPRATVGVGVPVLVGGQVAAVVYGDDGAEKPRDGQAAWAETLELLARHAARCLEAQTAIRAARLSSSAPPAPVVQATQAASPHAVSTNGFSSGSGSSSSSSSSSSSNDDSASAEAAYAEEHARRYARLLIADIRLYNEAAVRAGREHRDLWHRLQPDIARARRSFEDRVNDVADRERLFDEELVRTLADGDESLLGFDLGLSRPSVVPERLAV